jgi:hypothetical protein
MTRVQMVYQQLLPRLNHILPSVLIQLIAEYGPPSLLMAYVKGKCYVLWPSLVINAINDGINGATAPRIPKRTLDIPPTIENWSDGWQQLPIKTHVIPTVSTEQVALNASIDRQGQIPAAIVAAKWVTETGSSKSLSGPWMSHHEWCSDDWIFLPHFHALTVLHIPCDEPITTVWSYPVPSSLHTITNNQYSCYRADTGCYHVFNDPSSAKKVHQVLIPSSSSPAWHNLPTPEIARYQPAIISYNDYIIVISGSDYTHRTLQHASCDAYNTKTMKWVKTGTFPPLIMPRNNAMAIVADHTIFVLGGMTESRANTTIEVSTFFHYFVTSFLILTRLY